MEALKIKPRVLAEELGVSIVTLSRWRKKNRGPKWIAVGHSIRYRRSDLDEWLKQRECRKLT